MISSSFYNFWNTDTENTKDNHWVRWLTEQKTNGCLVKLKSVQGTSVHSDPSLSTFTFFVVSAMCWEYFPIGVRTRVSPCTLVSQCTRGKGISCTENLGHQQLKSKDSFPATAVSTCYQIPQMWWRTGHSIICKGCRCLCAEPRKVRGKGDKVTVMAAF